MTPQNEKIHAILNPPACRWDRRGEVGKKGRWQTGCHLGRSGVLYSSGEFAAA